MAPKRWINQYEGIICPINVCLSLCPLNWSSAESGSISTNPSKSHSWKDQLFWIKIFSRKETSINSNDAYNIYNILTKEIITLRYILSPINFNCRITIEHFSQNLMN